MSLARLRDLAKTDLEGTTALGLVKAAQKFKLETQAIQADMSLKANGILPIIASGLLVVYIFNSMFVYIRDFLLIILGQRLSVEIILGYIRHIFELPMGFFVTRKTGDIVSRFNDANKIVDALASAVISIFLDVGIVLVMGGILAIQNKLLEDIKGIETIKALNSENI